MKTLHVDRSLKRDIDVAFKEIIPNVWAQMDPSSRIRDNSQCILVVDFSKV